MLFGAAVKKETPSNHVSNPRAAGNTFASHIMEAVTEHLVEFVASHIMETVTEHLVEFVVPGHVFPS